MAAPLLLVRVESDTHRKDPYRQLVAVVLHRAIEDVACQPRGRRNTCPHCDCEDCKALAVTFLLSRWGRGMMDWIDLDERVVWRYLEREISLRDKP